MEIFFDSVRENEYASGVRVYCNGLDVSTNPAWHNNVVEMFQEQQAYFYLKKDENGEGLVTQAKMSTVFWANKENNRLIIFLLYGKWKKI